MNHFARLFWALFLASVFSKAAADSHMSAEVAKTGVFYSDFMKMSLEQRIQVCAQMVDSESIGECVTVKKPDNKPARHVSSELLQLEMVRCEKEMRTTDPSQLAGCARERLNKGAHEDRPVVTDAQIAKAREYCERHFTDTQALGSCMSGILKHIDHTGTTK